MRSTSNLSDVIAFIRGRSGSENVYPNTDIFQDLGFQGDDFHDLIADYAKQFAVDMRGYLWYFHGDEEGHSLGAWFFDPTYERVIRLPVTPAMLHRYAVSGRWDMTYPQHLLPKRRYDLMINFGLMVVFLATVLSLAILL